MSTRPRRWVLVVVTIAALAGCLTPAQRLPEGLTPIMPQGETAAQARGGTLLLIHGFHPEAATEARMWDPLDRFLRQNGWQDPRTVAYYGCDQGYEVDASDHGSHVLVDLGDHGLGRCGTWGHTNETSIAHLAHHLAWMIHEAYNANGVCVDALGHSQGGLILRYAWEASLRGEPGFPPSLCIEDAAAVGSPFGGLAVPCPVGAKVRPCHQMQPGSGFLDRFDVGLANGSTRWLLMASEADALVPPSSATATKGDLSITYDAQTSIDHTFLLVEPRKWSGRFDAHIETPHGSWDAVVGPPALVLAASLRGEYGPLAS